MTRDEAIRMLKSGSKGVDHWNQWRQKNPDDRLPNLQGAEFSCADLRGANLSNCDLTDSEFIDADLTGANLSNAILRYADLTGTNFGQTNLEHAVFTNAYSASTRWADVDLSTVKGLDSLSQWASSTVGIDTLLQSAVLPDLFLLGCGVPETLLEYVKALPASIQPIQFYSCFISYSHKDEGFARRLHGRLRQEGLRIWYAPENMRAGKKMHHQIDEAIRLHDKLLVVLSDASIGSDWVATEIYKARRREVEEGKRVLFPIRLVDYQRIKAWACFDADTGRDMAREIREYFIPDFSGWKDNDSFETAIDRLLDDLKKSAEESAE
jgi:hypothetical protein